MTDREPVTGGAERERRHGERRAARSDELTPAPGTDRRDTAKRNEVRFLVTSEDADRALSVAARELRGPAEAKPWYTTTYCDTPDRSIYRAALARDGVMFRIREYASERPDGIFNSPRIWIEWKRETATESQKWRFVITPEQVAATLRHDGPGFPGWPLELAPVVVTQCRREAFESRRGEVRVTADREVTYRAVTSNGSGPVLGPAVGHEAGVLVEVKWLEALPEWAERLVEDLRARSGEYPAKFLVAMHHLLSIGGPTDDRLPS
jgi:hypothetical protein